MALVIAHRGARSLAPENTMLAARKALELGADLWETDISVSADGQLVLIHDDSLVRTTNVKKLYPDRDPWTVTTFTLSELRNLDAGSWFADTDPFGQIKSGKLSRVDQAACRGEKIPTLREALAFTQSAGWRVNLELKRLPPPMETFPVVERVLGLIDELRIDAERLVISSFNHHWLRAVQTLRPDIRVEALIGFSETDPLDWGALEFPVYNARSTLITGNEIRRLLRKGIRVNVFTVNDRAKISQFIAAGAAGIITDFPQWMTR